MSLLDIANEAEDAKASGGGIDFKPPREGVALLRMCSYIETGVFEGEWKGKKKINNKVLVEFELVHPDHKILRADGTFASYHRIWVRLNRSGNAKSKYMQLFNKMNYDGRVSTNKKNIPGMYKFLNEPFMGQVYHNEYKEKTYANLDLDGLFSVTAARNPVLEMGMPTGRYEDIPVPEMSVQPRLFLWESKNMSDTNYMSMWDSIYIEGEKEDGSSKNWIQETILSPDNIALPGSQAERLFVEHGALDNLKGGVDFFDDPKLI